MSMSMSMSMSMMMVEELSSGSGIAFSARLQNNKAKEDNGNDAIISSRPKDNSFESNKDWPWTSAPPRRLMAYGGYSKTSKMTKRSKSSKGKKRAAYSWKTYRSAPANRGRTVKALLVQ
mmetsp:Transcript_18981/g.41138  ORF Transcript_18981/g.41138 Transcript_18981/m.41138 type:complete len:119 (-) Transcript_18981:180-536(-)